MANLYQSLVEHLHTLPPLPAAARKLMELTRDPNTSVPLISNAVSSDPALAAKVLKLANSPFYGMTRQISTVNQSVMTIGINALKNMALGLSITELGRNHPGIYSLNLEELWRHSLAAGMAARMIARQVGFEEPEEAFLAGLLHDIGKLVMAQYAADAYGVIIKESKLAYQSLHVLERELFEADHAHLGALLCRHWNIPDRIADAVEKHHTHSLDETDAEKPLGLVELVQVGNQLAKIAWVGFSGDTHVSAKFLTFLNRHQISSAVLEEILLTLYQSVQSIETYFGLSPSPAHAPFRSTIKVGCRLKCPEEERLIRMLLASERITMEGDPQKSKEPALWVTDETVPAGAMGLPGPDEMPALNFTYWKRATQFPENGDYPVPAIRAWLVQGIRGQLAGQVKRL